MCKCQHHLHQGHLLEEVAKKEGLLFTSVSQLKTAAPPILSQHY